MAERIGLQAVFEVDAFSQGLQVYLRGTAQAEASTNRTASAINSAGVGIAAGFGAAMGIVAVDAIQGFVSAAGNAISSALEITSAFEQLEFGIRALSAIQELLAGTTDNFSEAFAANKEEAQGWILLMQDIAIPSIFTTQQIAEGQRMLQVYGFTAEAAFEVNKALVEFATAGNLSVATMRRISYATGQLLTDNRLLQKDVKQFADAGIPIIEVIATKLGKTFQQVQKDMSDGLLTADVVMPILLDFFENFEGVTGESQKTLRGMFSALVDVKEIATKNFMSALLEPVVPLLQSIVRLFTDENFTAGATALGEALGPKFAQGVADVVRAFMSLFNTLTSLSPQTMTFIAILGGGIAVLTAFAAAAGIISLAMGLLVTSFTLPVAAVSAFVAAYATNFGNLNTITNNVINAVTSTISNAIGGFNDFASGIADALNSAAQSMGNFLGQVADWGSQIVSTLAEGITSAVSVVVDAIGVLASAISYLMAPGSPPRMLPKLTEWGKSTAEEWLHGWTQADFSILNDITNFVETALGKGASSDELIAVNETIAQAVHEIRNVGYVSEDTFSQIQNSLGGASDEVFGYLERYEELASATNILEHAQEKLNQTTQHYDNLISPLKQKLDAASEAVTKAKEATELKGLEILLNTAGVSDTRKAEALARIQQINARQQVSDLETQKQAAVDKIQTEIDGATKLQETAQNQLDLFQQRIQLQNEFIALIEKEQNKVSSGSSSVAKAQKEGLTALEKQLKIIQLQQAELQDMIAAAKARKVLEDDTATAAQKTAAQLELGAIITRQQLRDIEAAKLGATLDAIRQIQIVAADLEKPGKGDGKLAGIAAEFEVLSDADPEGRLEKFRKKVEELKTSFETMGTKIEEAATKANANLPVFLRFFNEEGVSGPPPLIANLTAALTGLAAFKFVSITAGLLGLGPAGAAAAIGIGLFTAAFQGDWFGIRDDVIEVVETIRVKFQELISIFSQGFGGGQISSTSDQLRGTADPIEQLAFKMGEAAKKIIEDVGKIGPAFTQLQSDLDRIFSGEGTFFSKLTEGAQAISDAFGENSAVMLALTAFTTFMGVTFAPLLVPAVTALGTLLGPIGLAALAISGLNLLWTNNIGGIKTYTEENFPKVGTAITTVFDTVNKAVQLGIDLIIQFKKDLDNLNLFGGASGEKPASLGEGLSNLPSRLADILNKTINDALIGASDLLVEGSKEVEKSGASKAVGESVGRLLVNLIGAAVVEANKSFEEQQKAIKNDTFVEAFKEIIVTFFTGSMQDLDGKGNEIYDAVKGTFDVVGTFVGITGQFFAGIAKGINDRVGEIISENEVKFQAISNSISDSLTTFLNSIIEQGNKIRTFFGLEALKKIEIPISLSSEQFKIIAPKEVDLSEAIKVTGQAVIEGSQLVRINEQNKLLLDANVLAALDTDTKLNLPADSLIEVNGEQRLVVDPSKVFETDSSVRIQLSPDEFITINKSKPLDIGEVDLSAAKVNFSSITTSMSDQLRPLAITLPEAELPVKLTVPTPLTTSDILGGGTTTIIAPVTPELDQLANPGQLGIDIGTGVTEGVDSVTSTGIGQIIQNAIDAAAAFIGAKSPATVPKELIGIPIGEGILLGILESLQNTEMVNTALQTLFTTITTNYQTFRLSISTIQTEMLTDATLFQTNSVTAWTGWTTNVQTLIQGMYALLNTETITFSSDMQTKYTTLQSSLQSTVSSITRIVTSLFSQMHSAVNRELSKMIEDILSKLAQLLEDIREDFVNEGEELGTDFAQGIVQGMLDHIDEIRKAAEKLAQEAVKAAQDSLVAKSPSEVTEKKVGGAFGQGAALGVLRSIPQAISAVNQLVDSMISQAGYALDSSARSYGSSNSTVNNSKHYHLNVQSAQQSRGIVYDYGIMQLMEGS